VTTPRSTPWKHFVVSAALLLACVGCQKSSSVASAGTEAATDEVPALNVVVVADLSDRIASPEQVQRDAQVIEAISGAFLKRAEAVGYPFCTDRLRFQGIRSTATSEDLSIDVGALNAHRVVVVKELPDRLASWARRADKLYSTEGPFVGADLWGYVAHDLDAVLVHDGTTRNKLILITDGYLNFANGVARPRNTEMRVAALRQAGARWESQFPRYALAGVGRRFEDCDLLVLEVAPKDPMRNVTEADILRRYWSAWADSLGMSHASSDVYLNNAPLSSLTDRVTAFLTK
jgi:hypothetical protein